MVRGPAAMGDCYQKLTLGKNVRGSEGNDGRLKTKLLYKGNEMYIVLVSSLSFQLKCQRIAQKMSSE
eukprot:bmy_07162T0